ncbi:unnamed protein product [Hyaloperonospora brassicae]|uniref:Uncharacterized protein n=1 Tax=Hyaloperonospora brassicae TaxID=162125 RepID=A0AAV0T911_HYABA|nr:unnamed protein product [Hyaloperonospora brassicae]
MAYLDKTRRHNARTDVNKLFLLSTIRSVDLHNRRQQEDKCWSMRRMERKLDASRDECRPRTTSRRRDEKTRREAKRRRSPSRSQSPSRSKRCQEDRKARGRSCSSGGGYNKTREDRDARSYWARKKAEKSAAIWGNLYSKGTVSTENAPAFSSEAESTDDDVKLADVKTSIVPERSRKKHRRDKKKRDGNNDKVATR